MDKLTEEQKEKVEKNNNLIYSFAIKYKLDIEYNEVFVDFDDCLLLEKRYINDQLMAFLFRCRNKGIKITLITNI